MGELKELRDEQESIVNKLKEVNEKLYFAALGAVSKVEERTNSEVDKLVTAAGDDASEDNKVVAIAKGVIANVKAEAEKLAATGDESSEENKAVAIAKGVIANVKIEAEKLEAKRGEALDKYVAAGNKARGEEADELNKYVLASIGAYSIAREESEKLFNELVEAGEQRA